MRSSGSPPVLVLLLAGAAAGTGACDGGSDRPPAWVHLSRDFRPTPLATPVDAWREAGWEIELTDGLREVRRRRAPIERGTEIVLERDDDGSDVVARLRDAAQANARFLVQRDDRDTPLRVQVDGRAINEPFNLPAPSIRYRSRGARVVVGLGAAPRGGDAGLPSQQ